MRAMFRQGCTALALTAAAVLATGAEAATSYPGSYDATSVTTTHRHGDHDHSLWLVGLLTRDHDDRYWQFEGGAGSFTVTDSGASLSGTVVQNTDPLNRMDLNMSFAYRGTGAAGEGSGGPKCGPCGDTDTFDYFDFVSATLTGVAGSALDGLSVILSVYPLDAQNNPAMPPQMGDGANDKNPGLGFSTWFQWMVASDNTYALNKRMGRGDVNLNLAPVPVPAAGLLLLGALGGLGVMRRRRKPA